MSDDDRSFGRFNRVLGGFVGVFSASLFLLMFYMDPVVGNLTRMGGLLENDYGWNVPQEAFPEPLFDVITRVEDLDGYYDVVVVGDSFSQNTQSGWQNFFVDATDLTLATLHVARISMDDLLSSEAFRVHPPRLFVYESIERNLLSRHRTCPDDETAQVGSPILAGLEIEPRAAKREWVDRSERLPYRGISKFDNAINFERKWALRRILGLNRTEVQRFRLARSDLFSSRQSDELLIITRDYRLKDATERQVATVGCSLLALQARVESNGFTQFIALNFPDKTSAYSDYIVDDEYVPMSILSQVEETEGLRSAKLLSAFRDEIDAGAVDVFLPNDEHCGALGYKIAADALVSALRRAGLVKDL